MILLDTHVLSEFIRPAPAAQVVARLDAQAPEQAGVSAVTHAEIELGVSLLPDGQRKRGLHLAATVRFTEEFAGRCLPFDERVDTRYASTRNESDIESIEGLAVVNPWSAVA